MTRHVLGGFCKIQPETYFRTETKVVLNYNPEVRPEESDLEI